MRTPPPKHRRRSPNKLRTPRGNIVIFLRPATSDVAPGCSCFAYYFAAPRGFHRKIQGIHSGSIVVAVVVVAVAAAVVIFSH